MKRTYKPQKRGIDRNKTNTPIAHQKILSVQPPVSAMTHDTLNTLSELKVPMADRNVITLLLQPQGQRQKRNDKTEDKNANEPIACRNKPTAGKVSRISIATLTHGVWINNEIINYMGRVLIAPNQHTSQA